MFVCTSTNPRHTYIGGCHCSNFINKIFMFFPGFLVTKLQQNKKKYILSKSLQIIKTKSVQQQQKRLLKQC